MRGTNNSQKNILNYKKSEIKNNNLTNLKKFITSKNKLKLS